MSFLEGSTIDKYLVPLSSSTNLRGRIINSDTVSPGGVLILVQVLLRNADGGERVLEQADLFLLAVQRLAQIICRIRTETFVANGECGKCRKI